MKYLIFTLIYLVLSSPNAYSQTLIAYIPLPKVLDKNSPGAPYNQLMKHLLKRVDERHHTIFMPSQRANKALNQKEISCIFPVVSNGYQRSVKTIKSNVVNKVSAHLFSIGKAIDKNDFNSPLVVVYLRNQYFGKLFSQYKNIKFVPVDTENIAINLVVKQRASAYLGYFPDINLSIPERKQKQLNLERSDALLVTEDRMECIDDELSRHFVGQFNNALNNAIDSGEHKKLLSEYFNL